MLLVIAAFLCSLISAVLQGDTVVRLKSGQNTALHCRCPQDGTITFLWWSKVELQSDWYMLFRRDSDITHLNSSFKGRVELKDGDLTLILKNVSIRDAGIYECCVIFKKTGISETLSSSSLSSSFCIHHFTVTVRASEQRNITAGQTVVLPCRAPNSDPNTGVKWSRPDLEPQNVLFYLDKKSHPEHQHPSFKNRADLQDRQMKDGDVSLILREVTAADSGTYECHVFITGTNRGKRGNLDGELINTISLGVGPPGQPGGATEEEEDGGMKDRLNRLVVGLCVFGVFLCVVVFLIHRRHKEENQDSNQPPAEQQQIQKLQLNHESPAPLPSDLSTDRT